MEPKLGNDLDEVILLLIEFCCFCYIGNVCSLMLAWQDVKVILKMGCSFKIRTKQFPILLLMIFDILKISVLFHLYIFLMLKYLTE